MTKILQLLTRIINPLSDNEITQKVIHWGVTDIIDSTGKKTTIAFPIFEDDELD